MSAHRKQYVQTLNQFKFKTEKYYFQTHLWPQKCVEVTNTSMDTQSSRQLPLYRFSKNSNDINKCANSKSFANAENASTITSKNTKLFLKHCVHVGILCAIATQKFKLIE